MESYEMFYREDVPKFSMVFELQVKTIAVYYRGEIQC